MLKPHHRSLLLTTARQSIEDMFLGRRHDFGTAESDEELMRPSGAFVSLHTHAGELRGCIGTIQPVAPLIHAVSASAVNAAFRDPRFHPLRREELDFVQIEISVMSPIEETSPEEVMVGRDGLIVSHGARIGLLLPQVATQYGWDRETFLSQTCLKAGLRPEAWRSPDCRLERFSAEVFGE